MKFLWMGLSVMAWGQIDFIGVALEGVSGVSGISGAEWLDVAPDGKHLYATGAAGNSLAAFERLADGTLLFVASYVDGVAGVDGLFGAQGVVVSDDDLDVYVTGSGEDKLAHFSRDPVTGLLTFLGTYSNTLSGPTTMQGPVRLVFDPSGKHLYASCVTSGSVIIYRRDPVDGDLTYVGAATDGSGFDGLAGATGMAFEPTGKFLFVSGSGEDAIAVLERDGLTGMLSYVTDYRDGVGGVDGIAGTNDVAVSGRYLFATGFADSALAFFRVTISTGMLTFMDAAFDGVGGVDGLAGPIGVDVSPDGTLVVVSGFSDDALALFERIGSDLYYRDLRRDGIGGVDGVAGTVGVLVSDDGDHVYATGFTDSAVAQFETVPGFSTLLTTWADSTTVTDLVAYISALP